VTDLPENNPDVAAAGGAPGGNILPENPVLVYDAPTIEAADIVCATLAAAGIPATVLNAERGPAEGMMPYLGFTWAHGVFVAPSNVEAARAILNTPAPTEEELTAEEEADPTTLAEAEARVKDA